MEFYTRNGNSPLKCYGPDECGYLIGYHGLSIDGAVYSPEAQAIQNKFRSEYPADDYMDFFWAMLRGERAAEKERDERIMRRCNAKQK